MLYEIRYKKDFAPIDSRSGYSCYLLNEDGEKDFCWYIPSVDGMISTSILEKIAEIEYCGGEIVWRI